MRYFPCDGLCGSFIEVPAHIAAKVMKPNGTILPHDDVYCDDCTLWWYLHMEDQQVLLLPPSV